MRVRPILCAALAALLLPTWAGPAGAAGKFAPHRALYDMSLKSSDRDMSVLAVNGEMMADWGETCEGWTLEYRSALEIEVPGEDAMRITTNVSTWEARDGLSYRFTVRNVERDGDEERIEGTARLDGKGQGGTAHYTKPEEKAFTLPPGTIFPTAHTEAVLAAAGDQPASFRRIVFDGLSTDSLFDVSAVMGAPNPDGGPVRDAAKPIAGLKSWPAHLAFFHYASQDAAPDNEMSFRMFANGVEDEMTIDFGRFKVLAKLKALELSPRPTCK